MVLGADLQNVSLLSLSPKSFWFHSFRNHVFLWWFSLKICENSCFLKVFGSAVEKHFFEEREGQEPQGIPPKNWMNLLLSAEPPRHSHPRFLDSSHKILRSLLGDSRRFLWDLLLKTRWIGWLLFVGHPNRVSCLKNWMLCVAGRVSGVWDTWCLFSFCRTCLMF